MERNVQYTLIGVIFLILGICMIVFIFWIGRYDFSSSKMMIYKLYTNDDMSGISVDTPVKYKGISVGSVTKMGFKKNEIGTIEMQIAIDKNVKVYSDSELVVDSQGLAGISYLSLVQNNKGHIITNEKDAILKLGKSAMKKLLDNASELGSGVEGVLQNLQDITKKERIDKLNATILGFDQTRENLNKTLDSINRFVIHLDERLQKGEFNYKNMAGHLMDSLRDSLNKINGLVDRGSYFFDRLENNPYDTLLGKQQ